MPPTGKAYVVPRVEGGSSHGGANGGDGHDLQVQRERAGGLAGEATKMGAEGGRVGGWWGGGGGQGASKFTAPAATGGITAGLTLPATLFYSCQLAPGSARPGGPAAGQGQMKHVPSSHCLSHMYSQQ